MLCMLCGPPKLAHTGVCRAPARREFSYVFVSVSYMRGGEQAPQPHTCTESLNRFHLFRAHAYLPPNFVPTSNKLGYQGFQGAGDDGEHRGKEDNCGGDSEGGGVDAAGSRHSGHALADLAEDCDEDLDLDLARWPPRVQLYTCLAMLANARLCKASGPYFLAYFNR